MDAHKVRGEDNYQCREVKVERDELRRQVTEQAAMIERVARVLRLSYSGSCTCDIKTPAATHHRLGCRYRQIMDVLHEIETSPQALTAHDNAIRAEVAEECAAKVDMLMQMLEEYDADSEIRDGVQKLFNDVHGMTRKDKEEG